jgi:tRNA A-37 threonylcarbamoyl transferase component Bud32
MDGITGFPAALAGQYLVRRELWDRADGQLFLARRTSDRSCVAVLVAPGFDPPRWARARARLRDLKAAAARSRYLPKLEEAGREPDGRAFAVFAVPDECATLAERMPARPAHALPGVLVVRRVLAALAALHDLGLAHGWPNTRHVLLSGRAVVLVPPLDPDGAPVGEVRDVLSPERIAGGPASPAADVYLVGLMLYELCARDRKGAPELEGLLPIVGRAMEDAPAERFADARGMRAALDAYAERERARLEALAREAEAPRSGPGTGRVGSGSNPGNQGIGLGTAPADWDAELPAAPGPVDPATGAGPIDAPTGAGPLDPPTGAGAHGAPSPSPMPASATAPRPAPARQPAVPQAPAFDDLPAGAPSARDTTAAPPAEESAPVHGWLSRRMSAPEVPPALPDPDVTELAERLRAVGLLERLRAWVRGLTVWLTSLGGARDAVDCTVCAPPAVAPGDIAMVQVFVHTPAQAGEARALAKTFDAAAEPRAFQSLETDVRRGTRLDFQLVAPGFAVDRTRESLVWKGRPGSVNFFLPVPRDFAEKAIVATVLVSEAGKPLGHVRFKLDVAGAAGARPRAVGIEATKYRRAYLAYAEPDRAEALRRAALLAGLGIEVQPSIDGADVFLLFWSARAKASDDVARTVRDAVRRGIAIVPVLLEGPPVPAPPPELEGLRFGDFVGVLETDEAVGEGTLLEGRFKIERLLGHGGMGAVYLAQDRARGGEPVAIKLLLARFSGDAKALEMLREEAAIAMRLSHPNIVRLHNVEGTARTFLAMEFVEGGSLADQLAARLGGTSRRPADWSGKGLAPAEIAPLLEGIAAGLDHAHAERVIHRDIKPANVLLQRRSTAVTPKVGDFGIARQMREGADAATQPSIAGTPPYMSPEHLLGERLDARADVYSLAATVYALLGGHPPFRTRAEILKGEAPAIPGVPPGVMRVVARGLAKDPAARPATCGAFAQAFRAGLEDMGGDADTPTAASPPGTS